MENTEFKAVLAEFNGASFSTYQLAKKVEELLPEHWQLLVDKYGHGGKGAGKNFSAYSSIAHYLNKQANDGALDKLDYRPAPEGWGSHIIRYWTADRGVPYFPEEAETSEDSGKIIEGARKTISVNKYERSQEARKLCIEKWGVRCFVCDFDFEETYGSLGAGYIHIHHLKPLSEIGEEYELDPQEDLRPLCPNCHAMVHRQIPAYSIDDIKKSIDA